MTCPRCGNDDWYEKPRRCRPCHLETTRRWRERNPERVAAAQARHAERKRQRRRERQYGLTPSAHRAFELAQDGRCWICRSDCDLHVDHDHRTGLVRGLLCAACNKGLGHFQDEPELLWQALRYLTGTLQPSTCPLIQSPATPATSGRAT